MNRPSDIVLSASRRTDIPAFYLDWFMACVDKKEFNIPHPYTRKNRRIRITPGQCHTIVFWSKNYDLLLNTKAGETLIKKGFHLHFNFTINSESQDLEPSLPPLNQRIDQLRQLADSFGPRNISWRFDPVCFYTSGEDGQEKNNLNNFEQIAFQAGQFGLQTCVTSFFDHYSKINRRLDRLGKQKKVKLSFLEPTLETKQKVIQKMTGILKAQKISLFLCCEKQVFSTLDSRLGVQENACIDGQKLKKQFGGNPETKRDTGQRTKLGCRCTKSIDIGSYEQHPCFHNCLFCYANPALDSGLKLG